MRRRWIEGSLRVAVLGPIGLIGVLTLDVDVMTRAFGQDAPQSVQDVPQTAKPAPLPRKRDHKAKARSNEQAQRPLPAPSASPVPTPAMPNAAPQTVSAPALPQGQAPQLTTQLATAGTRTCLQNVEGLGAPAMQGVTGFGVASNWLVGAPDSRPVSVLVGQRHGSAVVPNSATGIFAVPVAPGKCDGMAVDVIPSPQPCAAVKQSILSNGKLLDDLAGVSLLQNADGQVMLVPTGANTCVLVGLRYSYAR